MDSSQCEVKILEGQNSFMVNLLVKFRTSISVTIKSKTYSVDFEDNYFKTLLALDKLVNADGFKILCNGTSKDTFCRGFCINMAQGDKIYYKNPKTQKLEVKDTLKYEEWNEYVPKEVDEKGRVRE